jgi:hypothetical protein
MYTYTRTYIHTYYIYTYYVYTHPGGCESVFGKGTRHGLHFKPRCGRHFPDPPKPVCCDIDTVPLAIPSCTSVGNHSDSLLCAAAGKRQIPAPKLGCGRHTVPSHIARAAAWLLGWFRPTTLLLYSRHCQNSSSSAHRSVCQC